MAPLGKKTDADGASTERKNWYKDRYETVVTQRNFLSIIAIASLCMALVTGFIVLLLIPSKSVIPFLIQVDDKSGFTQIVDPESQTEISADEALRKYFIVKFLKARESYDSTDTQINAEVVRLLSATEVYRQYYNDVLSPTNKESLYIKMTSKTVRLVRIRSVQFLDANLAQVRYTLLDRPKNQVDTQIKEDDKHFIALISFEFLNLKLELEEMLVNPLGFRVNEYKKDVDNFR